MLSKMLRCLASNLETRNMILLNCRKAAAGPCVSEKIQLALKNSIILEKLSSAMSRRGEL